MYSFIKLYEFLLIFRMGDMSTDMKSSQPPKMMTFKTFLISQEDTIDEDEAVRRYHEYKTEFKRTQLSDFFVMHKDEEWYVIKFLLFIECTRSSYKIFY